MGEIFELLMIICFGLSWPLSVYKSYKARTTAGKSLVFLSAIWIGYICGIASKIMTHNINYVLVIYIVNLIIVSCDLVLYFRNKALDMEHKHESRTETGVSLGKEVLVK